MPNETKKLKVTDAPHVREQVSSNKMMIDATIALLPATLVGIYIFGIRALVLVITCIVVATLSEWAMLKLRKKNISSTDISSSALTGLLLALCLPSALPWYLAAIGAVISIVIAKHAFGGLGYNIFNPALVGRAFLVASWPVLMTTWLAPTGLLGLAPAAFPAIDAITTATPLAALKSQFLTDPALRVNIAAFPSLRFMLGDPQMLLQNMSTHLEAYWKLLIGFRGGSLGETSGLALIIGALFLLKKGLDWRIPSGFIVSLAIVSALFGYDPIFQVLAGGLLLGALFMATDPVTSPLSKQGRWIFGIGCGLITFAIRLWGGYPEGVCYAILLMNAATPLIDRYVKPRVFGAHKR